MKRLLLFTFFWILCVPTIGLASDFSSITIGGWSKEKLASDHLRFTHPKNKDVVLHLQIDSFNPKNLWSEENLEEEISKMATIRRAMSFFLGNSDYSIDLFSFQKSNSAQCACPILNLSGSYSRVDNQAVKFNEINFYFEKDFIQLKVISESELLSLAELETIIKEINPSAVTIK